MSPYFHDVVGRRRPGGGARARSPPTSSGAGEAPGAARRRRLRRRAAHVRSCATGAARCPTLPMRLVYSVRSAEDVIYADELGDEAALTYTREAPDGWTATRGGSTPR